MWPLSARVVAPVRTLVLRDYAVVKKKEGEDVTIKS